jgi:hypothetical protein
MKRIIIDICGKQINYNGEVIGDKKDFIIFKDKFGDILTINKRFIVYIQEKEEDIN